MNPRGIPLKITARRNQSELQKSRAYRIEGQVAIHGNDNQPLLLEDSPSTIAIGNAELRLNSMVNQVLAQGLGQIVEWSRREGEGLPIEVIKVMHRCWNDTRRIEFHATYLLDTNITSKLTMNALAEGNIISLRGRVVAYTNTWEIEVIDAGQDIRPRKFNSFISKAITLPF
ncbi:uncharacterized protein MELLADRAFT_108257 [Melampsora larici-populina 98AG31]|uniref:Uncharacterized protein n=1 Tax=Melampsora larici-populina (strain 98AG31 / pathotype 3-4-7) TaxID=747676 RepID=F4RSH5_MELLP|nr:uncharacterized protein MELLADRAFT_108257 [Melampsora larici-populina 98AG31]EGG04693.1 hypothetical protein MELLADRAFT_108257 [Melampsora larici-populina 98AG31]